jgi:hypothetical protein
MGKDAPAPINEKHAVSPALREWLAVPLDPMTRAQWAVAAMHLATVLGEPLTA